MNDMTPVTGTLSGTLTRIQKKFEDQNGIIVDQADTIIAQAETIADLCREMGEMDKEIGNLVEALNHGHADKIAGLKLKKVEPRYVIAKNKSWLQSAKIGFRESVLFAPTYLARDFQPPIAAALTSVGLLVVGVLRFTCSRPALLIAGLIGVMTEPKIEESAKKS